MSKPTGDTRFHIGYGLAAIQIILTGIVIVMISNLKTYNPDTQVPTTSTSTSSVSLKTYKDLATDIKNLKEKADASSKASSKASSEAKAQEEKQKASQPESQTPYVDGSIPDAGLQTTPSTQPTPTPAPAQ